MEMHQVRYFLTAAKALSFTRAAELCNVSQPALTTAIKKLEAQLGSPLFHREGRQVALTEFGRRMQPPLAQILEQANAAETVAKDFRLLNQVPLRLGVMSTIGPMRLAGLLAAFDQQSPGVDATVRDGAPEALAAQLDADELDLAILNPLDGLGENYRAEPLYTERYVVVLPPEHPLRERLRLKRQELGVTFSQVAQDLGWDGGTLTRYLNGECRLPEERRKALEAFLGAAPNDLVTIYQHSSGAN